MEGVRAGGRIGGGSPNKCVRLLQKLAVLRNKLEMVAAAAPWGVPASGALVPVPLPLLLLLPNRAAGDDSQVAVEGLRALLNGRDAGLRSELLLRAVPLPPLPLCSDPLFELPAEFEVPAASPGSVAGAGLRCSASPWPPRSR